MEDQFRKKTHGKTGDFPNEARARWLEVHFVSDAPPTLLTTRQKLKYFDLASVKDRWSKLRDIDFVNRRDKQTKKFVENWVTKHKETPPRDDSWRNFFEVLNPQDDSGYLADTVEVVGLQQPGAKHEVAFDDKSEAVSKEAEDDTATPPGAKQRGTPSIVILTTTIDLRIIILRLLLLILCVRTGEMSSSKRRVHVSRDGTKRVWCTEKRRWEVETTSATAKIGSAPLLLIKGPAFADVDFEKEGLMISGRRIRVGKPERRPAELRLDGDTGDNVWDGSVVLAKFLEHAFPIDNIRGRNVIELGSGTHGIAGLSASALGASSVLLTDLPYALSTLRSNVERQTWTSHVSVAALDWTRPLALPKASPSSFDVILAADCVWLPDLVDPFVSTLRHLADLKTSDAAVAFVALLAHQTRSRKTDEKLFRALEEKGFRTTELAQKKIPQAFRTDAIRVYAIRVEKE
eukprot:g3115.t1